MLLLKEIILSALVVIFTIYLINLCFKYCGFLHFNDIY